MRRLVMIVVGCSLLLPSLALGQAKTKTQEIVFGTEDVIEATLVKPDITDIGVRPGGKFETLIRLRDDFSDKVSSSVSEL